MAFLITTTGVQSTVTFDDLGERKFNHTTTNFDLESEYAIEKFMEGAESLFNLLRLPVVVKSFYCNNEHNFIERCSEMCDVCKDLQD